MGSPEKLAIIFAGIFFLVGLLTGVWKYQQIKSSASGSAHIYVDICHRASLLYAFASMLLAKFAEISQLNERLELIAMSLVIFYFASAIFSYMAHGILQDTENQLKAPFSMGKLKLSAKVIAFYMYTLIFAEVGGFLVLFYGVVLAIL